MTSCTRLLLTAVFLLHSLLLTNTEGSCKYSTLSCCWCSWCCCLKNYCCCCLNSVVVAVWNTVVAVVWNTVVPRCSLLNKMVEFGDGGDFPLSNKRSGTLFFHPAKQMVHSFFVQQDKWYTLPSCSSVTHRHPPANHPSVSHTQPLNQPTVPSVNHTQTLSDPAVPSASHAAPTQ